MTQVPAERGSSAEHSASVQRSGRPQVLAVVNAEAGSAHSEAVAAAAVALRAEADVELVATVDLEELRAVLEVQGERQLVVVGGDGSLHAVVQALRDADRLRAAGPIGVVPLGTGNDLTRCLGLPDDPHGAAAVAVRGGAEDLSLLVDQDDAVVVNVVHAGAGAEASARSQGLKPRIGPAAYPVGALLAGASTSGWRLRVTVDEEVLHDGQQPVLMVALGLGGTVGGGAPAVPNATPGMDVVHVIVSTSTGPLDRLGYTLQMSSGSHLNRGDVNAARAYRSVSVEALGDDDAFRTSADGEVDGPYQSRSWTVVPSAWQIRAPDNRL